MKKTQALGEAFSPFIFSTHETSYFFLETVTRYLTNSSRYASTDPTESGSGIRIRNRGSSQRNNKKAPGLNENTVT
jgi:hypothetical protein